MTAMGNQYTVSLCDEIVGFYAGQRIVFVELACQHGIVQYSAENGLILFFFKLEVY